MRIHIIVKRYPEDSEIRQLGLLGWQFAGTLPPYGDASKAYRHYVFTKKYREGQQYSKSELELLASLGVSEDGL